MEEMKLFGAGNAILYFREKNKLSQLQVCEGICTEMTLSRIETGIREFDSLISEVLLSRLGKTPERFEFVLNEEDYYLYEIREKIKINIRQGNIEEAETYLSEYKNVMPEYQLLHQQFLLYHEAILLKLKNENEKRITELLHEAINLTRPDYKEHSKKMILFSRIEVKIIYQLFLYENYSEETLDALMRFMETIYEEEEKEQLMIPFLYRFMRNQEKENNAYEVERLCTRAIEIIQAGRKYHYLADFYFSRVKAREQIWRHCGDWEERKNALTEDCNHIYYMSMIEENVQRMEEAEQFCKERLQCQITKPEI